MNEVTIKTGDVIRIIPDKGPERIATVTHVERLIILLSDLDEDK